MRVRITFRSSAAIHPEASVAPSSPVLLAVFSAQASAALLVASARAQVSPPPQEQSWALPLRQEEVCAVPDARPAHRFGGAPPAQVVSGSAQAELPPAASVPDDCSAAPAPDDSAESLPDDYSVVPARADSVAWPDESAEPARPRLAVRRELPQCLAES